LPKHCSEKKRSVVGPAYAEVIATRRGEIRYTAPDARRWLKWLFPRPARKGLLPRKICRWLAKETGPACRKSLQEVRSGVVLFVRRRRALPDDPLERAVFELEMALRRSGRPTPAGMTLRQLERRLGLSGDAAGYLRAVSAGRYAPAGAAPTGAQRRALRRELASGLGLGARLRTFWALPPRAR